MRALPERGLIFEWILTVLKAALKLISIAKTGAVLATIGNLKKPGST